MQDKASVTLSFKDATKLLEGLSKDPQLQADDDPSVLIEQHYPSEHHTMLQGKTTGSSSDNIITILRPNKDFSLMSIAMLLARPLCCNTHHISALDLVLVYTI
jgi:hypothetical protein